MDIRRGSSASSGVVRSHSATVADADLARMGYKSELPRNLSMLSVLGLSFAIMAVPYGLSTTMYITLVDGQSVTILWGWVLISLISVSIAASLAEICAVYPTAGGKFIQELFMILNRIKLTISPRCLLLECHDVDPRMGSHRQLDMWLVQPRWKLDSDSINQLRRRPTNPQRNLTMARRLRPHSLANSPLLLGHHARVLPDQRLRLEVPRLHQQALHLLDRRERHHHHGHPPHNGPLKTQRRVRLRPLRRERIRLASGMGLLRRPLASSLYSHWLRPRRLHVRGSAEPRA